MKRFSGVSASAGLVMGPMYRLNHGSNGLVRVVERPVREQALFDAAVILAKDELHLLEEKADGAQKDILMFQRVMLDDMGLLTQVRQRIEQGDGAAAAMEQTGREYSTMLENIGDEYMSQRSVDVLDVCRRVVNILDGTPRNQPELTMPSILISERIYPSDLISIDRSKILGLATSAGSIQSHVAIMARTMDVPAVVQLGEAVLEEGPGASAILDAYNGEIIVRPDADAVRHAQRRIVGEGMLKKQLAFLKDEPCITKDGTAVTLLANCSNQTDIRLAMESGADGVGMLRSEFMIANGRVPDETEQYYYYLSCLKEAKGKPVTVSTFDITDREWLEQMSGSAYSSPLELRGIRLQLEYPQLFFPQIRALLRAAAKGNLRIMFPMITDCREWDATLEMVEEAKRQLRSEGAEFCEDVPLGVVFEVPSAALMVPEILSRGCSFASIGTNDLTQYTYAADRMDERMSSYFVGWPKAVGRLVDLIVEAAGTYNIPVNVCGVNVTDPDTAERYVRQGVQGLSMEARSLMQIKAHLREVDLALPQF